MNKDRVLMIALVAMSSWLPAQNTDDAVRYSQTMVGGTALSTGMGGAIGAIGADFTSASINPGGLGLYRQSEFGGSISIFNASGSSTYFGDTDDDRKFNFNIPNFHLVVNTPNPNRLKTRGWLSTTFAIGYTKHNNLSEKWRFRGDNPDNSIVNQFIASAGNASPDNLDPFGAGLAYQTYLIDEKTDTSGYTSFFGPLNGGMNQFGSIDARGRIGETNIAFAGNYSNRLYVGGSLAIRRFVYERDYTFIERNLTDSLPNFTELNYQSFQSDRATSIALRAGAIYRVNDYLRLGAAALLPLDYTVKTSYSAQMNSIVGTGEYFYESPQGEYTYKLRQPARVTASAAFIYKKFGMLSVDYEMVNYSKTRLIDEDDSFVGDNNLMRTGFVSTGNLRAGLELRFNDLYVRGGMQYLGTPYVSSNFGKPVKVYSFGFGFRNDDFYFDAAYSFFKNEITFFPYSAQNLDVYPAQINTTQGNLVLSLGTRF